MIGAAQIAALCKILRLLPFFNHIRANASQNKYIGGTSLVSTPFGKGKLTSSNIIRFSDFLHVCLHHQYNGTKW
jgi:hypothetical protein